MLSSSGQQFSDWTQAYRLFNGERMKVGGMYDSILKEFLKLSCGKDEPVYAHMDDTLVRKKGKKVYGTGWKRDPLGPPFVTNVVWGQRFLQLSVSSPEASKCSASRGIPVDFFHCPTPRKPHRSASSQQWQEYKKASQAARISQKGVERVAALREQLDRNQGANRQLILSVDGGYTNQTVLKQLPQRVTLIGRIRKDCVLHQLPEATQSGRGRKRVYGEQIPTPEQLRQSNEVPWQQVEAFAAGRKHTFDVKVVRSLRWRKAGKQNLQLVIVRPLAYRPRKGARLLYRKPAYLICTDPELPLDQLLQAYIWRWEIEVNFRDEKSLIGCGEAQVRKKEPAENVPAFTVAVYAMLLLANERIKGKNTQLPRPKWHPQKRPKRTTTGDLINLFKAHIYARSIGMNFSHFVNSQNVMRNRKFKANPTIAATCYARK